MKLADSAWYALICISFLFAAEAKAQKSAEQEAKEAYEQLQGDSAGRGQTQSSGGAVQGSAGLKSPPAGMVEPGQKKGPDGADVPAPAKKPSGGGDGFVGTMVVAGTVTGLFIGGAVAGTILAPLAIAGAVAGAAIWGIGALVAK